MEKNKLIAKKELSFIGGSPKITEFWDDLNNKKIDILKCINVPQRGTQTCATIGLNNTDIGLVSDDKSLRIELVGANDILTKQFENIVASVAFEIMRTKSGFPGYVVKNVIEQYIFDCDMKHVLLTNPFLWEGTNSIVIEDMHIAWLMIVPISENEYKYACEMGSEALENIFEEKEIDIFNIYRKSII